MRASITASANFSGIAAEARRQQQHQPRHGDLGEDGEGDEQDQEAGKRLTGKGPRRLGALGMQALGEERNEGRVESALGEQPAKHVGHAEGDEVRRRPQQEVPSTAAISTSRAKPSTRLRIVIEPTVAKPR